MSVSRFYALKKNHPGSQAFYDSLYAQYAEWGVDMIKADCYFGDYYLLDQIQAVSDGIVHSGRPMLLSLSAGNGPHDDQVEQAHSGHTHLQRVPHDRGQHGLTGSSGRSSTTGKPARPALWTFLAVPRLAGMDCRPSLTSTTLLLAS